MGLTLEDRKALSGAGAIVPRFASIPHWSLLSGVGRTKSYELIGDGTLRAVHVGRRILVDVEHGLAAIAAMPRAEIRPSAQHRRAAAAAKSGAADAAAS